jgi:DNA repair exonuclease SbcCD nuclease subunit
MERTKRIKPSAILTSDWHLRESTPICFTGDFQREQWKAVAFVRELQVKYECPVIHAGDLFDHWKPSPWLLTQAIALLPKRFNSIYGQHDLPQHNWELRGKSGIYTLGTANAVKILHGCHYGQEPKDPSIRACELTKNKNVLVWHHMTYVTRPFPGATGGMAEGLIRKYPNYDLIVTGDNHTSFTVEYKGRRLVNPGNLTRQSSDQIEYVPRVALWYAKDNTIEWVNVPYEEDVISRDHIAKIEERDKRINAFISQLSGDWDVELSFEKNLERFEKVNKIDKEIMDIIYEAIQR